MSTQQQQSTVVVGGIYRFREDPANEDPFKPSHPLDRRVRVTDLRENAAGIQYVRYERLTREGVRSDFLGVDSTTSAQFLRLYDPVALPANAPPAAFANHDPFPPVREGTYR